MRTHTVASALRSRPLSALMKTSCLLALVVAACAMLPGQAAAAGSGSTWNWEINGRCLLGAGIAYNTPENWFNTGGYIACYSQGGTRRIVCKAVHRHTFYWHSHATSIDETRNSDFKIYSRPIFGTNGDRYKTSCTFYHSAGRLATFESDAVTL